MKTFILLFISLTGFINFSIAQWQHVPNGMGSNKYVYTLAAMGSNLYAGTSNGEVFYSSNNGTNWSQTPLTAGTVHSLFVNNNNIYAGTTQGIYRSTNNGSAWTNVLNEETVFEFASLGSYLYAAVDSNGVFISFNGGLNWTQTLQGMTVYSLGTTGNSLLAGTAQYGIYKTDNFGVNWTAIPLSNNAVFSFTTAGSMVFAGTSNGIYTSTNDGSNWTHTALDDEYVSSLSANGNNIFAGTFSSGVFISNNNGANWIQRNEGLTQMTASSLCILNNYLFNGTQNSVFRRGLNELIGIHQISGEVPKEFSLLQNYPNPFNPVTNIQFTVPNSSQIKLRVYDMLGREVETLVNEGLGAGTYRAEWNASKLSTGVYFIKLEVKDFTITKKMMLVK